MTHLLDTSAILALHFDETGAEEVEALFADPNSEVIVCVLSFLEIRMRLEQAGESRTRREAVVAHYAATFDEIVEVDDELCSLAADLKSAAKPRLPMIDALIAATAKRAGAILVHRDPHYAALGAWVEQMMLPAK